MAEAVPEMEQLRKDVQADGYTDAVLLGMGGSSLAPEVFRRSFSDADGLTLHVLDSTHPVQVETVLGLIDLEKTLFIVSSKSGGTIETMSHFQFFHEKQPDGAHFVAVTDPGTSLAKLGADNGFRRVFENDSEIGGRYSALSFFGLVPAALMGIDVGAVVDTALAAAETCKLDDGNAGLWLGAALGELALHGRDKLTFVVDEPLESFGLWVEQLIAESTGKQGRGILPVADEPLVDPSAYGDDRVFLHLAVSDEDKAAKVAALRAAGHPTFTVRADGPTDLGRVFFVSEFATAVAGWALGINPFDQPNVQEAKDNTKRVLDEGSPDLDPGDLEALLGSVAPPRYVAIMAYLPYSEEVEAGAARLRERIVSEHGWRRPSATGRASCTPRASSTRAARAWGRRSPIT